MQTLLVIIAVLAAVIALGVWEVFNRLGGIAQALGQTFAPRSRDFLDDLLGTPNPPRSTLDQMGMVVADTNERLGRIENILKYLRNYTWEVQDHRHIDDIRHPEQSARWGTTFGPASAESADYGLWHRERDYSEGFDRDVIRPALERLSEQERGSQAETDEDPSESDPPVA